MAKSGSGQKKYHKADPRPGQSQASKGAAKIFLTELVAAAEPVLAALGFELVMAQCPIEGGRPVMRLFVDHLWGGPEAGDPPLVGLEECAEISRALDDILAKIDESEAGRSLVEYSLEVSSPGLDRPLVKPTDYGRFNGRLVKLKLKRENTARGTHNGQLTRDSEGRLAILTDEGILSFDLNEVVSCRLSLDDIDF